MRHGAKIDLETRLRAAKDDLLSRAAGVTARHEARVAQARAHRLDPVAAGAALEAIAKSRSYRLAGHATFDAFARAELGFTRQTAYRLRVRAASPSRALVEADDAAAELRRWLRALGVRPASVSAHRRPPRVALVIHADDIARITAARVPRTRR